VNDLATHYPEKTEELLADWAQYVEETGVIEFERQGTVFGEIV